MAAAPLLAAAADPAAVSAAVVERTNEFRKSQGLEAVSSDAALEAAARAFARFMARTGKYGHGADGRTPPQRAAAAGYDYCLVAENIAYQYRSRGYDSAAKLAAELVEGWKNSPEHRKNMLEPAATETGVGIAQGEAGRYFAVQMFGRPQRAAIRFSVENASGKAVQYRAGGESYTLAPRVTRSHMFCGRVELTIRTPKTFSARPSGGERYTVTSSGVR